MEELKYKEMSSLCLIEALSFHNYLNFMQVQKENTYCWVFFFFFCIIDHSSL